MDLSSFVLVGRYDLPEPTRTDAPAGNLLAQEASGVAYNWDTDTLFVVGDGGRSVTQVSKTGELIDTMTLASGSSPQGTAFYDLEGITYVGGGMFVATEERDRNAVLFTYQAGTTLDRGDAQIANIGTFIGNIGLEGVSYDPLTGGFIFVKETNPQGVFQSTVDFATNTASNGSATTVNSTNLFDPALMNLADIADVYALSNIPALAGTADEDNLLILSQESGKIVEMNRDGTIVSELTFPLLSTPTSLSVADMQPEGLTMDGDGFLYVVSENGGGDIDHPQLWVFALSDTPNQAPTGISIANAVTAIGENTSTVVRVKVGDVSLTDDGLGTNALSLTGADAAFFEVDNTGLYIKAGTVLDYETKTSYAVTVVVDDASVGGTPDATTDFLLSINDIVDETAAPTLFISEIAPWSSGNSPVGVDWFEVTNNGPAAIDITGWKMDDGSAAFGSAVALTGVTTIGAGESVIFLETDSATVVDTFRATWSLPGTVQVGTYTGGGVSLSTGGDGVTLFDGDGNVQAKVTFGASPSGPFATFNNAAGLDNAPIDTLSEAGVNGAVEFVDALGNTEIGSPGSVGRLFISEVAPWSSGDSPVGGDWFELTNSSAFTIDISGWKMDDASQSPVAAVALNGVTSIAPGESVIFIESDNPAATIQSFIDTWFGGAAPLGLQFGTYSGSGIGLSTGGDAVNIYDTANVLRASVYFGSSTDAPALSTFDNAAGLNDALLTNLSITGINGAFQVIDSEGNSETGSPGAVKTVIDTANQPPTAVSLANAIGEIAENSNTLSRIKVADVVVTDDGLGGNLLSLTGADAAFFEVDATGLYLKAGTVLDYEAQAAFMVTVNVDDPTVGSDPDASTDYTLNLLDIAVETGPALVITEVAPWSSGDSPVGEDWFELTNVSNAAVDISGWRFDDDSASIADSDPLLGITTIAPGESVIFLNTPALEGTMAAFIDNWFGGVAPANLRFGYYDGSGLGTGGDGVTLFDATGTIQAAVTFGASPEASPFATFDNAAGRNFVNLSTLAVAGVDDAFAIVNAEGNTEIGSPGSIGLVPVGETLVGGNGIDDLAGGDLFDTLKGGDGDDRLRGGGGDDMISGGRGNDMLSGGAGDDVIRGGRGDDVINGGTGNDRAHYSGALSDYTIFIDAQGRLHIMDSVGNRDGNDVVQGVESFAFEDGVYALSDLFA